MVSAASASAWALFKLIRIFILTLSTIVSIGWTALYIVLLIHGWSLFMVDQRAIVLALISIYGISSIVLYLMIVVLFRPWMNGAWAAFLVLFQAGGTAIFFLIRPYNISKAVEDVLIIGGWSLSGLLLFYAFLLATMSYVPVPAPRPNPEAALAINLANEKSVEKEKRLSAISVGSRYSQSSFIGPMSHSRGPIVVSSSRMGPNHYRPGTPSSARSIVPSILYPADGTRTPSITSPGKTGYNYGYRPGTPGSLRSMTSSASSTRNLTNPRYNYIAPSRVSSLASSVRSASSSNPGVREPISRQGTPISRQGTPLSVVSYQNSIVIYDQPHPRNMTLLGLTPGIRQGTSIPRQGAPLSVVSYQDPMATNGPYDQRQPRSLTPPGLTPGVRSRNTPQPLALLQPLTYSPNMTAPLVQPASLRSTPPGIHPPRSGGSGDMSVPRSPSPQGLPFNTPIPATPLSAVLPAHPGLPKSPYQGRRVHEVRRYGSVPDIRSNDTPTYANAHHRAASDYPGASIDNSFVRGYNEQDTNIQRRRQDLLYNATR